MTHGFAELEAHRPALTGHCYRMLGSVMDADDAVQEAMVRAWKAYEGFDGRASVRTWLYKIATNVCLDTISDRKRRARPTDEGQPGTADDELVMKPRAHWLEPVPSARAIPEDESPASKLLLQESIRLAFVAALQHLPAKQRAALLLTEVLGWSANEVAESLDTSVAGVNSALQRARTTLAEKKVPTYEPLSEEKERMLARYVEAFHAYDVDTLTSLLRDDATLNMPPVDFWLQGPTTIRAWLEGRGSGCRGSRLLPVSACGAPAFAQYRVDPAGGHRAWAIVTLELAGDKIAGWTSFLDTETLFPRFDLPMTLPS